MCGLYRACTWIPYEHRDQIWVLFIFGGLKEMALFFLSIMLHSDFSPSVFGTLSQGHDENALSFIFDGHSN